ncbi:RNA polymerase sigma factor SigK [Patiriisocius marinistellae]|uniref:RNA polymerase sigma factor SigK n=1 Tax=Patiriisocius marinistellae TaxID=2494560 RepID=A0A5J4FTQ4_9FLAO|nr:RNA polymerase sigma factor [Patiriisocius marinistellae]GEQ85917.1 RNA polymerase sigma factor SigK [Patiriisocius marinistellae]
MRQPDELILEMQNGNEKAFARIYTLYSEALYGIVYSVVRDSDLAEETLQDVFIKIWNNSKSYDINKGRFFTWALNIARNTSIDATRSKAYKNSKKNLSTTNFVDIISSTDNLNKKTNSIGIAKFVERLKPVCIKIIDLLYFKGYTQVDAAKELEMPLGTIKTRNRNCIKELQMQVLG